MKKLFAIALVLLFSGSCMCCFGQAIKGTYAIKNVQTGMLLRIQDANKKNGTPLVAYSPVNWKCVTWDFQQTEGQVYRLKNLFTGKTFQPADSVVKEGVVLEQQPLLVGKQNQEYEFIAVNKKEYLIRLKNTDFYITPSDAKGAANTAIMLAKKTEGNLQHWTIYEQHPDL